MLFFMWNGRGWTHNSFIVKIFLKCRSIHSNVIRSLQRSKIIVLFFRQRNHFSIQFSWQPILTKTDSRHTLTAFKNYSIFTSMWNIEYMYKITHKKRLINLRGKVKYNKLQSIWKSLCSCFIKNCYQKPKCPQHWQRVASPKAFWHHTRNIPVLKYICPWSTLTD